jgi:alpha-beta hydrolase superfamily lysophospholipase
LPHYTVATAVDRDYPDAESAILGEQELDPLNHRRISGRLYLSFLDTGRSLIQQAGRLRCEALVVHGSLDDVTDVSASIEFAARAEGKCELDVWPGVYHELNREHRQRLHDRIGDWLSALPVDGRDRRTFNETL